jgi:hypothetical protein
MFKYVYQLACFMKSPDIFLGAAVPRRTKSVAVVMMVSIIQNHDVPRCTRLVVKQGSYEVYKWCSRRLSSRGTSAGESAI